MPPRFRSIAARRSRLVWAAAAVVTWGAVATAEDPAKPERRKELDNPHLVNHWAQEPRARELWTTAARDAERGTGTLTATVVTHFRLTPRLARCYSRWASM